MNYEELEKVVEQLWNKVDTLNERTKRQTRQIQELQKEIKKCVK